MSHQAPKGQGKPWDARRGECCQLGNPVQIMWGQTGGEQMCGTERGGTEGWRIWMMKLASGPKWRLGAEDLSACPLMVIW